MSVVQCSTIGQRGRFGNSVLQYLITRAYAEKYNCEYRIPSDWIGRKIFYINDCFVNSKESFQVVDEGNLIFGQVNVDLYGFFQTREFYRLLSIAKCKEWLKIKESWLSKFPKIKKFYIACHLRRGDMSEYHWCYPTFKSESYINGVRNYGFDINDIVWVDEDNPSIDEECNKNEIPFLPSFMLMYHADVIFRANSTFSFIAGLLGNGNMYSPIYDFPSYGGKVGLIDVDFIKGLGIDKEGIIQK